MNKNVIIVIGGQYGSEAKGKHVQDLCHSRPEIRAVVRTGAPNAGHSMVVPDIDGETPRYVAMQILPCGWTAKNVKRLYVGAGAQVIPEMLSKEFRTVCTYSDVDVMVDGNAMIQHDGDAEAELEDNLSGKVGSTGKGCGAALIRRIGRKDPAYLDVERLYRLGGDLAQWNGPMPECVDVVRMLNAESDMILVEGTQGVGLSLFHGPYPYTTSRDTTAANWLAEAGLSPLQVSEIHMVCRTYPIRVAGNSGPMEGELCWSYFFNKAKLDQEIIDDFLYVKGSYEDQDADPRTLVKEVVTTMIDRHGDKWQPFAKIMEFTTVTKLPRRIGSFDFNQFERAVIMNRPTHVALEFCNYVTASDYGMEEVTPLMDHITPRPDFPLIKYGEMSYEDFCSTPNETKSMAELKSLIATMNVILEKHSGGAVTHLGISRNATLALK